MKASKIRSILVLWIVFVIFFGLLLGFKPMDSSSVEYRTISVLLAVSAILFLGTVVGAYVIVPLFGRMSRSHNLLSEEDEIYQIYTERHRILEEEGKLKYEDRRNKQNKICEFTKEVENKYPELIDKQRLGHVGPTIVD
jgi:hypothetical protein